MNYNELQCCVWTISPGLGVPWVPRAPPRSGRRQHPRDLRSSGSRRPGRGPWPRAPRRRSGAARQPLRPGASVGRGAAQPEPRRRSPRGGTPLHYAASQGHAEVTEFLLGARASVEAKSNFGRGPQSQVGNCSGGRWKVTEKVKKLRNQRVKIDNIVGEDHVVSYFSLIT